MGGGHLHTSPSVSPPLEGRHLSLSTCRGQGPQCVAGRSQIHRFTKHRVTHKLRWCAADRAEPTADQAPKPKNRGTDVPGHAERECALPPPSCSIQVPNGRGPVRRRTWEREICSTQSSRSTLADMSRKVLCSCLHLRPLRQSVSRHKAPGAQGLPPSFSGCGSSATWIQR